MVTWTSANIETWKNYKCMRFLMQRLSLLTNQGVNPSNGGRISWSDHFGPGMSEPDSEGTWKLGIPDSSLEEDWAPPLIWLWGVWPNAKQVVVNAAHTRDCTFTHTHTYGPTLAYRQTMHFHRRATEHCLIWNYMLYSRAGRLVEFWSRFRF